MSTKTLSHASVAAASSGLDTSRLQANGSGGASRLDAPKPHRKSIEDSGIDRWLSPRQVTAMLSISEATLYRWVKQRPEFPRPVKFSRGCTRFSLQQLRDFAKGEAL